MAPLLSKAIKVMDLFAVRASKAGRILDSPWVYVPDVASFKIELRPIHGLFALFGIEKKYPPKITILPLNNSGINRYLEHQIIRLKSSRGKPSLYWAIAKILMKRSNSFRVCAVHHVFKNWYRNYPLGFIINTNRKVSKLINQGIDEMDYKRVYIPKGEKGYRPLGVPKPEWRLYLHMYSNFLTYFLEPNLKHQHGFLPGRGTLTAWKEIMTRGLTRLNFIKEWDFKNYFNSIHSNRITEELLKYGVPKGIAYFLENVNRSQIKLTKEDKVDESPVRKMKESQDFFKSGGTGKLPDEYYEGIDDFLSAHPNNINLLRQFMAEDGCGSVEEFIQLQWALLDSYRPAKIPTDFNGVAQGAPTSPILANLIMDLWIKEHDGKAECVAYADDSVSFSNQPIEISPPSDTGIEINADKSDYVKWEGKWLKPLKFLGLEFDGTRFRAQTRKGSNLEMDEDIQLLLKLDSILPEELGETADEIWEKIKKINFKEEIGSPSGRLAKGDSWEDYFRSRLIGFVQSRLYSGEWNLDNLEQDFDMKFVNGSWMDTKLRKQELDVFVASSYANRSLLNIFRWNQKLRKPRSPQFRAFESKRKVKR